MGLQFLNQYRDFGLLILRLGIGGMFIFHGWPKIMGGPDMWERVGGATSSIGINFAPTFFGFMAALTEFGGGVCLILGLLLRPVCILLMINMIVATAMHLANGDGLNVASHAIEDGVLFLSLIFIGPGRLSLDEKLGINGIKEETEKSNASST